MNLIEKIILKMIQRKVDRWFDLERSLAGSSGGFASDEWSPEKTWPDPAKIPLGGEVPFNLKNIFIIGPHLRSCIRQGALSIMSLNENPADPQSVIEPAVLEDFERYARSLGVGAIGYARLPRRLVFKERAVLFDNVIVLLKEMDQEKIARAPSLDTFKMVFETYDSLGKVVNLLTNHLRSVGYGAQGGHPLGGLVLYPPLAALAGLGWMGRHGLLITPQFGPRQRIGAIFTSIANLPVAQDNPHDWVGDFCGRCGRCIRTCPSKAVHEHPVVHESGRKTHISREKCLPVFVARQGCTICIKECPFSSKGYDAIHQSFVHS